MSNELTVAFETSLQAVSKYLKVLRRAGFIGQSRQAQSPPCKLEAKLLQEVTTFLAQYQQFWRQRLYRLDSY